MDISNYYLSKLKVKNYGLEVFKRSGGKYGKKEINKDKRMSLSVLPDRISISLEF
jgi:hypothetical protein